MLGIWFPVCWALLAPRVSAQVLTPPMFNLAEGRKINATATCGDLNGRSIRFISADCCVNVTFVWQLIILRERYCYLAGASAYSPFSTGYFSYENDFAELRIGSSQTAPDSPEPKDVVEVGVAIFSHAFLNDLNINEDWDFHMFVAAI